MNTNKGVNLVGAVIGAVVEIGSQVISNAVAGKGFKMDDNGWAKVGVAAVEGFITDGASNLGKAVIKVGSALGKSYIDNHKGGVGAVLKGAAVSIVTDKVAGSVAKLSKAGDKTMQKISNKIIGSKNQITKNIIANNAISTKAARAMANSVQSAQKDLAKAVREAPKKAKEIVVGGTIDGSKKRITGE